MKFKQMKYIVIQTTNDLNNKGILSIRFNSAQERSDFIAAHHPIKLKEETYPIELNKDVDTLVMITVPLEEPLKNSIPTKIQTAFIDYFKTNCQDAYDYNKKLEIMLVPAKAPNKEKPVQPENDTKQTDQTRNLLKPTRLGLLISVLTYPGFVIAAFLKAPANYPIPMGMLAGALLAFNLSLGWFGISAIFALTTVAVAGAVHLRNYLYQKEANTHNKDVKQQNNHEYKTYKTYKTALENDAYEQGMAAGTSWILYAKSFYPRQGWLKHPIVCGAGMKAVLRQSESEVTRLKVK
ncbi:MAG: hypothetical protein JSS07_02355 [Proteobacteria bacterium]|nr:hypothetical protein [Pseudomonadota bacterium]